MLSGKFELIVQLILHLIEYSAGKPDAAGFGQALQAGGHIYAVSVELALFFNHIAQVDADTKKHSAVFGKLCVSLCQLLLDIPGTAQRVYNTGKFSQHVVAGRVDHLPAVLSDQIGHNSPVVCQRADGLFFILAHQAAVADNVCAPYGTDLAFITSSMHGTSFEGIRSISRLEW